MNLFAGRCIAMLWFYLFGSAAGTLLNRREAQQLCEQLNLKLNIDLTTQNETDYETIRTKNWVHTAWGMPTCIFTPHRLEEIQTTLPLIIESNVSFAVRSGGHSPHHGFANIDGGILIDMSGFKTINYHDQESTVTIGVGLTWGDVYTYLEQYEMTAVGARVLDVGVGGMVLGGGLSWFTDMYGLACDNVVNFQIVLANGTVANANNTTNTDLFWALKGGGNNFGILTEITTMTYPLAQVWGGIRTYSFEKFPELIKAYSDYQEDPAKDPAVNLHILVSPTNSSIGIRLTMVHLKPEANPPALDPFYSINATSDNTAFQSYTDFLADFGVPEVQRFDWFTTTFKHNESLYNNISETVTTSSTIETVQSFVSGFVGITWQPISQKVGIIGEGAGGNCLGLQAVTQTWLATAVSWWFPQDDGEVHRTVSNLIGEIQGDAMSRGNNLDYMFMNDASWSQAVIQSYGEENVRRLKQIQNKYDPNLVFQYLVPGGFKLPAECE